MKIRKTGALLLVLLLLAVFACQGLADDGGNELDTSILDAMNMSADEWLKTSTMREYFVGIAILEMVVSGQNDPEITEIMSSALASEDCYITTGTAGLVITVIFFGEDSTLMISYIPLLKTATWNLISGGTSLPILVIASMKSEDLIDEYYTVDSGNVLTVLTTLNTLISE